MKPSDVGRAIVYPLVSMAVLVPLVVFWLLLSFARWGGVLGLFLMFLVIPAVFRFQMIVLEARAHGEEPAPPTIEFFNWFGNAWTLFPVPLSLALIWATVLTGQNFGEFAAGLVVLVSSIFFPASIAVLAITHSPLQSLNPLAISRLYVRSRGTMWIATAYLSVSCWLSYLSYELPLMFANLVQLVLSFSFFSLVGSLIEPFGLVRDVYIPDAQEAGADQVHSNIERARAATLSHAYGFISRDNRGGGFKHIIEEIKRDPDPARAWAWYFDGMMRWENQQHALFFAQHHIADMLDHGEEIPALKTIIRCRAIDGSFKPYPDDIPRAIEAAERNGNTELAAVLKRG